MEARLEDFLHAAGLEARTGFLGHVVTIVALAVKLAETIERQIDPVVAEDQRARHFFLEDEEFRNEPRPVAAVAVEPAIGPVRRNGSQNLRPLLHVEIAS